MIDLDYKNESNDYILDMFYGIEDEEFYIGIKYKDGSVSKYPFTIHNYNAIILKMEKQYYRSIKDFSSYKILELITELLSFFTIFLCFLITNDKIDDKIFKILFLIISTFIMLLPSIISITEKSKLSNKELENVKAIDKYLKNKENFLIELLNGDFTYGLNISNINDNTKEMPYNEEIKGQIKLLKYIAEKENSRDGLNG